MTLKHQVFISSTYTDLVEHRKEVIEELLKLNCIPVAMEFFQPIDKSLKIIKGFLDNCDYVVLIVAGRYGSVIKRRSNKISFTQEEYNYAKRNKIPIIPFLLDEKELIRLQRSNKKADRDRIEKSANGQRLLARFRKQLMNEQLVSFFKTEKELPQLVSNALAEAKNKRPMPGWVRSDQVSTWNIIYSASEKVYKNKIQYEEIKPLFKGGKGLSAKLKLAFPLTKWLLGKNKSEVMRLLPNISKTILQNAVSSDIYRKNSYTKAIELNPDWVSYDLVYAMCHVSEYNLHVKGGKYSGNSFPTKKWWETPWNNVILYISQICSEEGFFHLTRYLLREEAQHSNEKTRIECLKLIYQMVFSRSFVNTDLLNRVFGEILSVSPGK